MPIRPEQRAKYPADWKQISQRIRFERAKGRCEWCGVEHGKPRPDKPSTIVILTTAHLDQNPENNDDANLAALCQACHLGHDRHQHAAMRARHDSPLTKPLFPEPDLNDGEVARDDCDTR